MLKTRYVMVGGFLGAGKTTAILRAAKHFHAQGLKVGLITNDQSHGLVDTTLLEANGFPTEEIGGGCFCCRFNSLVEAGQRLEESTRPDLFLAEPVGSCTDLVATVVIPLQQMYGEAYALSPMTVLIDPVRAQRVLGLKPGKSFSPKVTYIYQKQLEEAQLLVINKCELLNEAELKELTAELQARYPRARVLSMSARSGLGVDEWLTAIQEEAPSSPTMDVDYDTYAEGEALLGWVNLTVHLSGAEFDGNAFLKSLIDAIQAGLRADVGPTLEIAHLKATLTPDQGNDVGVANLVREDGRAERSHDLAEPLDDGELIINLRAEADPLVLQSRTQQILSSVTQEYGIQADIEHQDAFRPVALTQHTVWCVLNH